MSFRTGKSAAKGEKYMAPTPAGPRPTELGPARGRKKLVKPLGAGSSAGPRRPQLGAHLSVAYSNEGAVTEFVDATVPPPGATDEQLGLDGTDGDAGGEGRADGGGVATTHHGRARAQKRVERWSVGNGAPGGGWEVHALQPPDPETVFKRRAPAPWVPADADRTDFSHDGTYVGRSIATRGPHLVNTPFYATASNQHKVRPLINDIVRRTRSEALAADWRADGVLSGYIDDETADRIRWQVRRAFHSGFCSLPLLNLTAVPQPLLNTLTLQYQAIRELHMADNKLTTMEVPVIMQLSSLETLSLRNNEITYMDETMSIMTRLVTLDLSLNKLKAVPRAIFNLPALKFLSLEWNRIQYLPNPIDLKNIEVLKLAMNRIEALPDGLHTCRKLVDLDMSRNVIPSLLILPTVDPLAEQEDSLLRPWEWEEHHQGHTTVWFHPTSEESRKSNPVNAGLKMRLLRVKARAHAMLTQDVKIVYGIGRKKKKQKTSSSAASSSASSAKKLADGTAADVTAEADASVAEGSGSSTPGSGGGVAPADANGDGDSERVADSRGKPKGAGTRSAASGEGKGTEFDGPAVAVNVDGDGGGSPRDDTGADEKKGADDPAADAVAAGITVTDTSDAASGKPPSGSIGIVPPLQMDKLREYKSSRLRRGGARPPRPRSGSAATASTVHSGYSGYSGASGATSVSAPPTSKPPDSATSAPPPPGYKAPPGHEQAEWRAIPEGATPEQLEELARDILVYDILARVEKRGLTFGVATRIPTGMDEDDFRDSYWRAVERSVESRGLWSSVEGSEISDDLWRRFVLLELQSMGRSEWQMLQDKDTGHLIFRNNVTLAEYLEPPGEVDKLDGLFSLTKLNLARNKIVSLPRSLATLTALKTLDLDHNSLTPDSFPEGFDTMTLTNLSIRHNKCATLPEFLPRITTLERLMVCGNHMVDLTDHIGSLVNLRDLYCTTNDITGLPKGLAGCTSLQRIHLGLNEDLDHSWIETSLKGAQAVLWRCRQMIHETNRGPPPTMKIVAMGIHREARVAEAETKVWFQGDLRHAYDTGRLKIHWKAVKHFPEAVYTVPDLNEISFIGNSMRHVPIDLNYFSSLTRLQMRSNKIVSMPNDSFETMTALTDLGMEDNRLKKVPESIVHATLLRTIAFDNNRIRVIPEKIGLYLTKVVSLTMSHNKIREIPPSVGKLVKLRRLWLNHNRITDVPPTMSFMTALQSLRVNGNRLVNLSRTLAHLPLKELQAANNQIVALPRYILVAPQLMTNLTKLWLQANAVTEVSNMLYKLQALQDLSLDINPLRSPPKEVAAGGLNAVLEYSRIRDEHIHDILEAAATAQIIMQEDKMFPKCHHIMTGGIGHLTAADLDLYDKEVDGYVNGLCHQCPLTAEDIVARLERRREARANQVRGDIIAKLRRVLEACDRGKWVEPHSFSSRVMRPWGPARCMVRCFAITAEALFGASGEVEDAPESVAGKGNARSESLYRGLGGPKLTMNAVLDALRNYRGASGIEGVPVDTIDFAMLEDDALLEGRVAKVLDEERARVDKDRMGKAVAAADAVKVALTAAEIEKEMRKALITADADGLYEMRKHNTKPAIVVQRIKWEERDVIWYEDELQQIVESEHDVREDAVLLFKAKEGADMMKATTKADKAHTAEVVTEWKPRLVEHTATLRQTNRTAVEILKRKQAFMRGEPASVHKFESEEDMEDDVAKVLEELQFAQEDYEEAKRVYDPVKERRALSRTQFRREVQKEITAQRVADARDDLIDGNRLEALEGGMKRPWDGPDGHDFLHWKSQCKREKNPDTGLVQLVTALQRVRRQEAKIKGAGEVVNM